MIGQYNIMLTLFTEKCRLDLNPFRKENWSDESMVGAIKSVESGMSVRAASQGDEYFEVWMLLVDLVLPQS